MYHQDVLPRIRPTTISNKYNIYVIPCAPVCSDQFLFSTGFVDLDQLLGLNRTSWKSKFEDVAFEFCKSEFYFYFLAVFKFFFFSC